MQVRKVLAGLGVLVAVAACSNDPPEPSNAFGVLACSFVLSLGMLLLETVASVDTLKGTTATATIEFRLKNRGTAEIKLNSDGGCKVKPYIRNLATGQVVHSVPTCTPPATEYAIAGNAALTETRTVQQGAGGEGKVGLAKGKYEVFAMLFTKEVILRSKSDTLVVAD